MSDPQNRSEIQIKKITNIASKQSYIALYRDMSNPQNRSEIQIKKITNIASKQSYIALYRMDICKVCYAYI